MNEDISKLTIPQLKTRLAKLKVKLPSSTRSKSFYVELLKSHMGNLKILLNFLGEHDQPKEQGTPISKTPSKTEQTPQSSTKVKSRKQTKRTSEVAKAFDFSDEPETKKIKEEKSEEEKKDEEKSEEKEEEKPEEEEKVRKELDSSTFPFDFTKGKTEGEKEEEPSWESFIEDPNQKKLDDFIVIKPSPPKEKKDSPPKEVLPPKEVSPLKQISIFEYIPGSTPIKLPENPKPIQEEEKEEPKETGKQLTLDSFESFPVPKNKRKSFAPLSTLEHVGDVFISNPDEREKLRKEKLKEEALRRKSTPLPQKKGLLDKSYHTQSLTPQVDRRKSMKRQDTPYPKQGRQEENQEEEEEEEKQHGSSKFFFIIILSLLLLGLGYYGFRKNLTFSFQGFSQDMRFCYTEDHEGSFNGNFDCQPCPSHAYCIDGKLAHCETPFIKSSNVPYCIENNQESQEAVVLASKISKELKNLAGRKECGEKIQDGISFNEIKKNYKSINEEMNLKVFTKFLEMMSSPEFESTKEEKDEDIIFYSKKSNLPFICKLLKSVKTNITSIIWGIIILLITYIINMIRNKRNEKKENLERLTGLVLSKIKERKSIIPNDVLEEIKEEYEEDINIDEYWEQIELEIGDEERVKKLKNEKGEFVWEWKQGEENLNKQLFQ